MWQPGWEGSLGENGYIYIYDWIPLLSTWNYYNIVNWLYPNIKTQTQIYALYNHHLITPVNICRDWNLMGIELFNVFCNKLMYMLKHVVDN